MYAQSVTQSGTSTFTEARVRTVMGKSLDDFIGLAVSGHLSIGRASEWASDLIYALDREAAEMFQLRFDLPAGEQRAINYHVSDDGSLLEDSESGGIDYRSLPKGTDVSIVLRLRQSSRHRQRVLDYLRKRGWGAGSIFSGEGVRDRAYSKDGYGLIRRKIGTWE